MKKFLLSIVLALSVLTVKAQTNTSTNGLPALQRVGNDLLAFLQDNNAFGGTNSLRIVAGPVESGNHWGGLLETHIPLAANGQISPGFAVMYLNKTFYDANINLNLSSTFDVFKLFGSTNLSLPLNIGIESGPYVNMHDSSIGAQSGAFQTIDTKLGVGHLCLSATEITASTFPKPIFGALLSYGIGANPANDSAQAKFSRFYQASLNRGSLEIPWDSRARF
jgi:hypothetical protein